MEKAIKEESVVNAFWLEDEPEEVKGYVNELKHYNVLAQIYNDINKLKDDLKKEDCKFSTGIIDLQLTEITSEDNGIHIANNINGIYRDKYQVYPNLGSVSRHREKYEDELKINNPFSFEWDKADLNDTIFNEFVVTLVESARSFKINKSAMEYHNSNPITDIDLNEFLFHKVWFGIIEQIDNDYGYIRYWNPQVINSEYIRKYPIDFLQSYDLIHENQAVRYTVYKSKRNKGHSQNILEPIGNIDVSQRYLLREKFDYEKFLNNEK